MGCPAECYLEDNLVFSVCTHDPDTGVLTDANPVPAYRVYEDDSDTAILTGNMEKIDDANTTGAYRGLLACTAVNGFEVGKTYTVYIEADVDTDTGGISFGFKINPITAEIMANFSKSAGTIIRDTVDTGYSETPTTMKGGGTATLSAVDNHYKGRILIFTSGTLEDQATGITGYVGATKVFTFVELTSAPADGVGFIIV